jgi:signal transduction histidine kinase
MGFRTTSWLAWSLAGLALAVFFASVALFVLARSARVPSSLGTGGTIGDMLVFLPFLAFPLVGALIASKRPKNPIGWICLADGLLWMLVDLIDHYGAYGLARPGSLPFPVTIAALGGWLWVPAVALLGIYLILLFPNGRLPSTRWRPLGWFSGSVIVLISATIVLSPGPVRGLGGVRNPFGLEGAPWVEDVGYVVLPLLPLCMLASAVSLVLRYRRSGGEVRQQIKWIAFAASIMGLVYLIALASALVFAPESQGTASTQPFWLELLQNVMLLSFAGVPVAVGFAVLRYRLYDIDFIINRTLVYGALTVSVAGLYVLVVGYLGALLRTGGNLLVSLLAAGLVAVLFAPLRDRLQRAVDRLMYGERDDPYAVVSRLGQRLEATLAPEDVLSTIVGTVREALKLPYVAIALRGNDAAPRVAASVGKLAEEPLRLPLTYQGEPVGELLLGARASGETFGPADRRLLEGLTRQAGVAIHAVRLTNELQRSRERLVATREEERQRIRRDLHDGLGPALSSAMLKLGAARRLLPSGSPADGLIVEVRNDMRATVADVRRLVYDLRPPALDQLGLVLAIRDYAEQCGNPNETGGEGGLRVTVEAPEQLPPLPAAVEVAAYHIAREAMTNAARHARARSCQVRLALARALGRPELELKITDDGAGLSKDHVAGVGLTSMRERAEELGGTCAVESTPGGGTRVLAHLPVGKE